MVSRYMSGNSMIERVRGLVGIMWSDMIGRVNGNRKGQWELIVNRIADGPDNSYNVGSGIMVQ